MNEKIKFELSAQQLKFRDILNKEFLEMEIWAISDIDPNRNKTHFSLKSMEDALPGCKNKPIVGFFEKGDFTTHEGRAEYDKEYNKIWWNTENGERVLGVIRESDPVEIVEKDGLHWIKVRCALFVSYCYRQVKRLLKDKTKKVSVEITVHESEKREDGIEEILSFTLNGITILGTKNGKAVMEAIPGAHATILEDLDENVIEEQKKLLSFAYQQIDGGELNDKNNDERKEDVRKLELRELEDKLWREVSAIKIKDDDDCEMGNKYWIEKIYDTHIVINDNDTDEKYKVLYNIDEDGNVAIYWDSMKSLKEMQDMIKELVKEFEETYAVAPEDVASGEDITLDKSKESISERAWGSIDKTALREKAVKAGNFKTIADDIFLDLREGWEDGEVSKLKYPVMEINDNVAVYNRGALASAKAYAEKNGETEIMEKLNKIYEDLGLDEAEKNSACGEEQNFSANDANENNQDADVNNNSAADGDGSVATFENNCDNNCDCNQNNDCDCGDGNDDGDKKDDDEDDKKPEEDCDDKKFAEQIDELNATVAQLNSDLEAANAKCESYETKISELETELSKYADYSDIKDRMEKAEKTVWEHFCEKMKYIANQKLSNENVAEEDRKMIEEKAANGEYATEDDMDKEIAYAVYKTRQVSHTKWEHFEVGIGEANSGVDTHELSREERLKKIGNIKK